MLGTNLRGTYIPLRYKFIGRSGMSLQGSRLFPVYNENGSHSLYLLSKSRDRSRGLVMYRSRRMLKYKSFSGFLQRWLLGSLIKNRLKGLRKEARRKCKLLKSGIWMIGIWYVFA